MLACTGWQYRSIGARKERVLAHTMGIWNVDRISNLCLFVWGIRSRGKESGMRVEYVCVDSYVSRIYGYKSTDFLYT